MDLTRRGLRGATAGAGATLAMSAVMLGAKRAGLMGALPPRRITAGALDALGVRRSPPAEGVLAAGAHFAYGAAAGVAFQLLGRPRAKAPAWLQGLGFGALLWAGSYFGWVPAVGLMPPPPRDRPGRPTSMLLAHLVFGAVLGLSLQRSPEEERT